MWWYNLPANKLNCFVHNLCIFLAIALLIWTLCWRLALFTLVSVELRPRHSLIIITANWHEWWYDGFLRLKCWPCMIVSTAGTRFCLSAHQFFQRHCRVVLKVKNAQRLFAFHSVVWYGIFAIVRKKASYYFQPLQRFRTAIW